MFVSVSLSEGRWAERGRTLLMGWGMERWEDEEEAEEEEKRFL
jgi:hypothetical protein